MLRRLTAFFRNNGVDCVILALPSDLKCGGIAARLAGGRDVIFRRGLALPTRNTRDEPFPFPASSNETAVQFGTYEADGSFGEHRT